MCSDQMLLWACMQPTRNYDVNEPLTDVKNCYEFDQSCTYLFLSLLPFAVCYFVLTLTVPGIFFQSKVKRESHLILCMFKITDCSSFRKDKFFITSPFKKRVKIILSEVYSIFLSLSTRL